MNDQFTKEFILAKIGVLGKKSGSQNGGVGGQYIGLMLGVQVREPDTKMIIRTKSLRRSDK
jgi:hypothetical protein